MRLGLFALLVVVASCSEPNRAVFDAGADDVTDEPLDGPPATCTSDRQCDDRIACTVDHCRAGSCTHEPCTDCCPERLQCVEGLGCGRAPTPCTMDSECADGIRCTLDRCRDGRTCEHSAQATLCDTGEICLAAIGCIPRPPDTCRVDSDCNTNPCRGTWRCAPELGCEFRAVTSCDDGDDCTTDTCDDMRGGCQHAPRDGDMDGHTAQRCGGDDCDDASRARHPGAAEVCGNGVDEDCDGLDRGCCTSSMPCATSCGSMGVTSCTSSGMPGPCMAPAESCNGRDDDCDGMIDNSFACARGSMSTCTTTCGTVGTQTCSNDCARGACVAPAESCNGRDDDCDGMTDEGCCAMATPCTTACGTTGTTMCSSTGTPSGCSPPAETCNGRDDNCNTMIDEGFACARGSTGACMTSCGSMGTRTCNPDCTWGPCAIPAEVCNGRDDNCDGVVDNGFACAAGSTGACATSCGSMGRRTCLGSCNWDMCVPPAETCNGADDNCNATCDEGFTCCARSTRDCTALGFVSGTATCRTDCGGWDTSGCRNCGNRVRDGSEQCDGADLGMATCASRGFGSGTLRCRTDCTYDTTGCNNCGNGRIDPPGEVCDGTAVGGQTCAGLGMGFTGGVLRCNSMCALDTTMCTRPFNPTATWVVSPGITLYCAFGAVNLSFGTLMFTDTGVGLSVTGGRINCNMAGPSARSTRMINVTCTALGGCNETYTLTGTFSTDNAFSGTFTATYTGSGCFDCRTRSFPVSGSR